MAENEIDGPECPECEGPMVMRQGPHSRFWGCQGYPDCKGTRDEKGRSLLERRRAPDRSDEIINRHRPRSRRYD